MMAKTITQHLFGNRSERVDQKPMFPGVDTVLLVSLLFLLGMGLLMVATSSMPLAQKDYGDPLFFLRKQLLYVVIGLVLAALVLQVKISYWQKLSPLLLFAGFVLLLILLVPGMGVSVNGSTRWINLGLFRLQPSEMVKLILVVFMAGYIARRQAELQNSFSGFLKPLLLVGLVCALLLQQPDFGTTVVATFTVVAMLFLAGARLTYFIAVMMPMVVGFVFLVLNSPYRMERLTAFMDPWQDPFNSGFQLTQALIAFGRGEWFGMGLGQSVQKQLLLPEPHTDFVLAIVAEELGFIGLMVIVVAYFLVVWRIFRIASQAERLGSVFRSYAVAGIGIWIGFQVLISLGVNMGVLPTKGLTLPMMSYGGSSMVVMCVAAAFVMRADIENRLACMQAKSNAKG